jgi:hypothetical protein
VSTPWTTWRRGPSWRRSTETLTRTRRTRRPDVDARLDAKTPVPSPPEALLRMGWRRGDGCVGFLAWFFFRGRWWKAAVGGHRSNP